VIYLWETNRVFYYKNLRQLKKEYPGKSITIVDGRVAFATRGFEEWKTRMQDLTSDERDEAYTVYIERGDEYIVV
jgi:hypothetical protein